MGSEHNNVRNRFSRPEIAIIVAIVMLVFSIIVPGMVPQSPVRLTTVDQVGEVVRNGDIVVAKPKSSTRQNLIPDGTFEVAVRPNKSGFGHDLGFIIPKDGIYSIIWLTPLDLEGEQVEYDFKLYKPNTANYQEVAVKIGK